MHRALSLQKLKEDLARGTTPRTNQAKYHTIKVGSFGALFTVSVISFLNGMQSRFILGGITLKPLAVQAYAVYVHTWYPFDSCFERSAQSSTTV